jgi:hypothetical protein
MHGLVFSHAYVKIDRGINRLDTLIVTQQITPQSTMQQKHIAIPPDVDAKGHHLGQICALISSQLMHDDGRVPQLRVRKIGMCGDKRK